MKPTPKKVVDVDYVHRHCDCCGSETLEEVWAYSTKSNTRSYTWCWAVRNVICQVCGFAFVSPVPTHQTLAEYYADAYEYWRGQSLDYSIDKRVRLLQRYVEPNSRLHFVEVGGNASEQFETEVSTLFASYRNVELNRRCNSSLRCLDEIPKGTVDVLGCYFVLEHLPQPAAFFRSCFTCLKENGTLVVEVPNVYTYPVDPAGLYWWEHVNHFSPHSLCALAVSQDFHCSDISVRNCSRPFGFAAVFRKRSASTPSAKTSYDKGNMGSSEYHFSRGCMREGLELIAGYHERLEKARSRISAFGSQGLPVVLWAANRICVDLLQGFSLPENATIVDSNPDKASCLPPPYVPRQPSEVGQCISAAKLFVICTPNYANEILTFIRDKWHREVTADEVVVLDPRFQGY